MDIKKFIFSKKIQKELESKWESPSNIALVKYWGKKDNQIPCNPSISFTLSNCITTTSIKFKPLSRPISNFSYKFLFHNQPAVSFHKKIDSFFNRIIAFVPYLKNHHLIINSENSFPHSSGIASSASAMSSIALALIELERYFNLDKTEEYFLQKASFLARLGSGSAARSIQGPVMIWGKSIDFDNSSDAFGVVFSDSLHSIFHSYQDTILIIDKSPKEISSSLGHELMNQHLFASSRFLQANKHISLLKNALIKGDIASFIYLVEKEALTLHAMMMTSSPYFILMHPNTIKVIKKVWKYRRETNKMICFTLDAGANIHLLYPKKEKKEIERFIKDELASFCFEKKIIWDFVGQGSKKV